MKEICLDEGTIQAFLDGELKGAQMDAVTRHLALCDDCALLLSEAEEETALAFAALDGDMNTLVPTQRLWSKINDSIAEERRKNSFWNNISVFLNSLSRPSVAAFASLVIVAGLFAALLTSRPIPSGDVVNVDKNNYDTGKPEIFTPDEPISAPGSNVVNAAQDLPVEPKIERAAHRSDNRERITARRADYRTVSTPKTGRPKTGKPEPDIVVPQYLPGEETYIRTIANLSEAVNSQKDVIMKPSTRVAYERDLAVIDDAINKMKEEVRKNPKNEAAKDILFASYQNKINLLNTVAEKTELMASIR